MIITTYAYNDQDQLVKINFHLYTFGDKIQNISYAIMAAQGQKVEDQGIVVKFFNNKLKCYDYGFISSKDKQNIIDCQSQFISTANLEIIDITNTQELIIAIRRMQYNCLIQDIKKKTMTFGFGSTSDEELQNITSVLKKNVEIKFAEAKEAPRKLNNKEFTYIENVMNISLLWKELSLISDSLIES